MFTSVMLTIIVIQIVIIAYGLIFNPQSQNKVQAALGIIVLLLPLTFGIAIVSTLW